MALTFERLPLPEAEDDKARWWEAEKRTLLAGVLNRELIPDRPPDRVTVWSTTSSTSSHVERRHSLFTTWPVEVEVSRRPVYLDLRWQIGDRTLGLRVWHHDETLRVEQDIAGA